MHKRTSSLIQPPNPKSPPLASSPTLHHHQHRHSASITTAVQLPPQISLTTTTTSVDTTTPSTTARFEKEELSPRFGSDDIRVLGGRSRRDADHDQLIRYLVRSSDAIDVRPKVQVLDDKGQKVLWEKERDLLPGLLVSTVQDMREPSISYHLTRPLSHYELAISSPLFPPGSSIPLHIRALEGDEGDGLELTCSVVCDSVDSRFEPDLCPTDRTTNLAGFIKVPLDAADQGLASSSSRPTSSSPSSSSTPPLSSSSSSRRNQASNDMSPSENFHFQPDDHHTSSSSSRSSSSSTHPILTPNLPPSPTSTSLPSLLPPPPPSPLSMIPPPSHLTSPETFRILPWNHPMFLCTNHPSSRTPPPPSSSPPPALASMEDGFPCFPNDEEGDLEYGRHRHEVSGRPSRKGPWRKREDLHVAGGSMERDGGGPGGVWKSVELGFMSEGKSSDRRSVRDDEDDDQYGREEDISRRRRRSLMGGHERGGGEWEGVFLERVKERVGRFVWETTASVVGGLVEGVRYGESSRRVGRKWLGKRYEAGGAGEGNLGGKSFHLLVPPHLLPPSLSHSTHSPPRPLLTFHDETPSFLPLPFFSSSISTGTGTRGTIVFDEEIGRKVGVERGFWIAIVGAMVECLEDREGYLAAQHG